MAVIFRRYEEASGQKINYSKSSIIFGMKIPDSKRHRLQRILGIEKVKGGGKYLGLPEQFGRKKVELFDYIVKRVKERTAGWSTKFLSPAGKEILIKSIAMALPVYSMNCFLLPSTICDEINQTLSSFWWGTEHERRKIPWVAWERMSLPKNEGGLGFKDLHLFNRALLAKQAWRILMNPNSLLSRLYKGIYHPDSTFLQVNTRPQASYGWRSVQEGKELLKQGLRVRIGNGKSTKIWEDPWLPTLPPRPAAGPVIDSNMRVSDLWKINQREWDPMIFEGVLNPEDQQIAASMYLSKHATVDTYEWAYTRNAQYTVRSGYWVATHVGLLDDEVIRPPYGSVVLKREIWKLRIAPKLKHFLWRCLSGALATYTRLRSRTIPADPICQRCCQGDESINHILFMCPFAQAVWQCVQYTLGCHFSFSDNLEENISCILRRYKDTINNEEGRLLPIWILWRIWKSRNIFLFQKINRSPDCEVRKGINDVHEWLDATQDQNNDTTAASHTASGSQRRNRNSQWCPPPLGWVKCNFDSGFIQGRNYTSTGWVIRDHNGQVVLAGCAKLHRSHSSLEAEALGFLNALQVTWIHGFRKVWFEGDNLELTNLINTGGDHINLGTILCDIRHWMWKQPLSSLGHVNRERNSTADVLCRKVSSLDTLYQIFHTPPSWLINSLYYPFTV